MKIKAEQGTLRVAAVLAVLLAATAAWARQYTLTTSSVVPAAKGTLNTKTDKNGNTQVDLKLKNMAKPSSLTPPGTTYIVWFQQQGEPPQVEGQLQIGGNLKGEFKTTTPMKNFEVFATVENDPTAKSPTGQQVFHATVQQ